MRVPKGLSRGVNSSQAISPGRSEIMKLSLLWGPLTPLSFECLKCYPFLRLSKTSVLYRHFSSRRDIYLINNNGTNVFQLRSPSILTKPSTSAESPQVSSPRLLINVQQNRHLAFGFYNCSRNHPDQFGTLM